MNIIASSPSIRVLAVFTAFNREFVLEQHGLLFDRKTWHGQASWRVESYAFDGYNKGYWFGPFHWTLCKLE